MWLLPEAVKFEILLRRCWLVINEVEYLSHGDDSVANDQVINHQMYLRITHVHLQPQLLLGLYSDQWPLAATPTRNCVIGYASSIPCIVANCHLNDVNGCGHFMLHHDGAITWQRFPDYWPLVRVNHWPLPDSPPTECVFNVVVLTKLMRNRSGYQRLYDVTKWYCCLTPSIETKMLSLLSQFCHCCAKICQFDNCCFI